MGRKRAIRRNKHFGGDGDLWEKVSPDFDNRCLHSYKKKIRKRNGLFVFQVAFNKPYI